MNVAQTAVVLLMLFLVFVLPVVAVLAWWLKHRYAAAVVRLQATKHPSGRSLDDRADRKSGGLPERGTFAPPLQATSSLPPTSSCRWRTSIPTLSTSPGRATGSGRRSSASAKLKMAQFGADAESGLRERR